MSHFKTLCRNCKTLMNQCRCMSENKEIRYDLCNKCKDKLVKENEENKNGRLG